MVQKMNKFSDLDFKYPTHFLTLSNIKIPISIHIKDISLRHTQTLDILEDDYDINRAEEIELIKSKLNFINCNLKCFNSFEETFLEFYGLDKIEDILYFLDERDMVKYSIHISEIINLMIGTYRERLYSSLKLDEESPVIHYKDDDNKPKNLKEYLKFTDTYILAQSFIEFTGTPFFSENIGKGVDEYSWREIEFRMAYLTMKNKCESLEHKWQMFKMEERQKNGK